MSNLKTFDNLYASLSQSAYEDRPYNFLDRLSNNVYRDALSEDAKVYLNQMMSQFEQIDE